jgi:hypothetical protein
VRGIIAGIVLSYLESILQVLLINAYTYAHRCYACTCLCVLFRKDILMYFVSYIKFYMV